MIQHYTGFEKPVNRGFQGVLDGQHALLRGGIREGIVNV